MSVRRSLLPLWLVIILQTAQSLSSVAHDASSTRRIQQFESALPPIKKDTFLFRNLHPIAFERSLSSTEPPNDEEEAPVLLLNGFGMGSFHQHRFMRAFQSISQQDSHCRTLYGMDYLGQGDSWPVDCDDGNSPSEKGLNYSVDTWIEQVIAFLEEHQPSKHSGFHLVGNSVGGYIAVHVAARRPDLVASLLLLNATPIWGLNLPGWSGVLPPPPIPRFVGRVLFDQIRNIRTIRQFLHATYTHASAFESDTSFIPRIQAATTTSNGGHAAFSSILWSPPATGPGFWEQLERHVHCPVALIFGRDDPWCKPAYGQRMLRVLQQKTATPTGYWELSDVGHCPHHEAPCATAQIVRDWLLWRGNYSREDSGDDEYSSLQQVVAEDWGHTTITPYQKAEDMTHVPWWDRIAARLL